LTTAPDVKEELRSLHCCVSSSRNM